MNEFTTLFEAMRGYPSHISPSAYDTAWVAWLFDEARDWLIDAQHPDGSWGAEMDYYYDRVISTLAAINALAATSSGNHIATQIERGIRYLEQKIPQIPAQVPETCGYELILPNLVNIADGLGLKVDQIRKLIEPQMALYHQKLALVPPELIYSQEVPVAYSLEFLSFDKVDATAIKDLRLMNGSIHNSPAATAFVEIATSGSSEGRAYLQAVLDRYKGTAPSFAPCEILEIVWVLHHVSVNFDLHAMKESLAPFAELVADQWTGRGVGFSVNFAPDLDETSLALRILNQLGMDQDPRALEAYEVEEHFRCYPLERNISLDVHIHIIHALRDSKYFPRRDEMLQKSLKALERRVAGCEYIIDKWHISPYYSTGHAVVALAGLADHLNDRFVNWMLKTQRADGSWSFFPEAPEAAIEETAHALMSLMTIYELGADIPFQVLENGYNYLREHYDSAVSLPELWISKVVYNPYNIVDAVISSALTKYESLMARPHILSLPLSMAA